MPHSHSSHRSHERNLEKSLAVESSRTSTTDAAGGDIDVAARLAREAAEREAARRAQKRPEDAPEP